eukprot:1467124-Pleurochrysis_carterae.AAC.1
MWAGAADEGDWWLATAYGCLCAAACVAAGAYRTAMLRAQRSLAENEAENEAAMVRMAQEAESQLQEAVETARSEFFDYDDILEIGKTEKSARIEADKRAAEAEAKAAEAEAKAVEAEARAKEAEEQVVSARSKVEDADLKAAEAERLA